MSLGKTSRRAGLWVKVMKTEVLAGSGAWRKDVKQRRSLGLSDAHSEEDPGAAT